MSIKNFMKDKLKSLTLNFNSDLRSATVKMNKSIYKTLIVTNNRSQFMGVISDGDIRRAILVSPLNSTINNFFNKNSISCFDKDLDLTNLKKLCQKKLIEIIPITDSNNYLVNIYIKRTNNLIIPLKRNNKKLNIPILIMAGGLGTRMKPVTNVLPKPLLPLGDDTVVSKIMQYFSEYGLNNYFFSINYKKKIMKAYLNEFSRIYTINYIVEKKSLGTAGSLQKLKNQNFKNIIITNCDVLYKFDFNDLYHQHTNSLADITIVTVKIKQTLPYGVCELSKSGFVKKITEKPKQTLNIVSGMYIISNKIISLIKKNEKIDMNDLIDRAIQGGYNIVPYYIDQKYWKDLGTLDLITKYNNKNQHF